MSSCTHYYYAPNSNFTPLFTQRNEVALNLHCSIASEHSGAEFQGAYALGDHLAIMGTVFSATGEEGTVKSEYIENLKEDKDSGEGNYYEAALGYFTALNKGEAYRKGVFEIYGGLGKGNIINSFGISRSLENSFTKIFIQPSVGYKSKVFDIAFSGKLCMVDINFKDNTFYQTNNKDELDNIRFIQDHPRSLMCEPSLVAQLGWTPIKLKMQLTRSLNLSYSEYPQDDVVFAIGISGRFNVMKQKPAGGK